MKIFSIALLGLSFMATAFLAAAPADNACTCKNCQCTYETQCGCLSKKERGCSNQACKCSDNCPCGSSCACK